MIQFKYKLIKTVDGDIIHGKELRKKSKVYGSAGGKLKILGRRRTEAEIYSNKIRRKARLERIKEQDKLNIN